MSEAVDHGITVTEIAAMDQPIDAATETTAAFVGRALRGPVNTPVLVTSLAGFRQRFGGNWSGSGLGPAVKQYFENGGRRLYVVRVVNHARGAMICLPARGSAAVLRAVEPGSTEHIRAAVDYDGLGDNAELFNLTLQRVNPVNGLIVDQEFFRALSWKQGAANFVADELLASRLARLEHPYPAHRPEPTVGADAFDTSYVGPTQPGADGKELTDYDLIGSRKNGSGLLALDSVDDVDLLYLPPYGSGVDVGPTALLAAELYCRERGAMLIVDPRSSWSTAEQVVTGIRSLGYASSNMIGYFPRLMRRNDVTQTRRPAGAAIAGMLCKHDRTSGAWQDLDRQGMGLRGNLQPASIMAEAERQLLLRAGMNVLAEGPARRARLTGSVTMGRGLEVHREFASLPVRRLCLRIVNTIAKAVRWAVFESHDVDLEERICAQVLTYFNDLDELGAFADRNFLVQCNAGVNRKDSTGRNVSVLLVFRPAGSDAAISLTLHLTAAGCRVISPAFAPGVENCA
ncbi:MAG: hypothetical protein KJO46_04235 [Gammaproteobacteria bacterium]|nr:hypothetical protein [Gammaproteobacteria bacterium]